MRNQTSGQNRIVIINSHGNIDHSEQSMCVTLLFDLSNTVRRQVQGLQSLTTPLSPQERVCVPPDYFQRKVVERRRTALRRGGEVLNTLYIDLIHILQSTHDQVVHFLHVKYHVAQRVPT